MTTTMSNNNESKQVPANVPTYILGVPVYHENLYRLVDQKWLGGVVGGYNKNNIIIKRINTEEDFEKLESMIDALRTEKSELFIDPEYRPKPSNMKIEDYVAEFIKNKSVGTHYTFKHIYSIVVYPSHFDYSSPVPEGDHERFKWLERMNQRREYIIIPLYIILKRGKTLDQMKTLSYNEDGSYNVHPVKPQHFYKPFLNAEEEIDLKNKEIREKAVEVNNISS
jgi:hypothetical protein